MLVGTVTFIAGIILILRHLHVWRHKTDATTDEKEKRFLLLQMWRRSLTSGSIAILGAIIAMLYWPRGALSFTILVCCALVLTFMIFLLATLDFLAVTQAFRAEQNKKGEAAKKLVREYHRLKQKAEQAKNDEPPN